MEPVHSETVLTDIMQTVTVQRDPAPTDFTEIIQTDMSTTNETDVVPTNDTVNVVSLLRMPIPCRCSAIPLPPRGQRAGNCHSGDPDGRAAARVSLLLHVEPRQSEAHPIPPATPSPGQEETLHSIEGWQCMLWRDLSDLAELQDYSGTNRELCMSPPDQMLSSWSSHRHHLDTGTSVKYSKSLDRLEACFGKELGKTFEGILHPSLLVNPHQREAECGVECRTRGGQGESDHEENPRLRGGARRQRHFTQDSMKDGEWQQKPVFVY
ncbi:hypothetical protein J4Q44_G00031670 [Coregonus suidteri]|uniref:Uncharacterized protein n=1 Tax=Coregonus suidteri TaxID=861788 RepID=A0AAN8MHR6_9TELE